MELAEQVQYWIERRADAMRALEYANQQLERIGQVALDGAANE